MKNLCMIFLLVAIGCNKLKTSKPKLEINLPPISQRTQEVGAQLTSPILKQTEFDKLSKDKKNKYQMAYIQEVFQATRRIEATDIELSKWFNVITQNGSREGIYRGLVLDLYYQRLEGESHTSNIAAAAFTKEYMSTFLSQKFNEKVLKDVNVFSLKRVVSEKSLATIDVLRLNEIELYNWYALVSAYLAQNYGTYLNNKIRTEKNPEVHYNWANSVPEQHIKSEIVLKLHMIYNGLNQI